MVKEKEIGVKDCWITADNDLLIEFNDGRKVVMYSEVLEGIMEDHGDWPHGPDADLLRKEFPGTLIVMPEDFFEEGEGEESQERPKVVRHKRGAKKN